MLVIYASRQDPTAQSLVTRWAEHDATLLTAEDLSVAGWRYHLGSPATSTAVIGGRKVSATEIEGVLIRWPCVHERELGHIMPEDRAYVASEMFAFLLSWFTQLACPVLNRPTPTNLLGPSWRHEQWIHSAAKLDIKVRPARRRVVRPTASSTVPKDAPEISPTIVTVVGERCFGTHNSKLARHARLIADAAGVDLLAVYFDGDEDTAALLGANLWPDLTGDGVADAVLDYLLHRPSVEGVSKR